MEALQFICFLALVVGCLSLCSYYNARIEELEKAIEGDDDVKSILNELASRIDYLYDQVDSLDLFYTEIDENMKNYSYLKILEVEAINNRVQDKDLVVLENMKKEILEEMDE